MTAWKHEPITLTTVRVRVRAGLGVFVGCLEKPRKPIELLTIAARPVEVNLAEARVRRSRVKLKARPVEVNLAEATR